MHAEKREPWVRNGIDQPLHDAVTVTLHAKVCAPKGNDSKVQVCAAANREPVRPGSRAEDCKLSLHLALLVPERDRTFPVVDGADLTPGNDRCTAFSHFTCDRVCHEGEVHDSGGRRPKRRASGCRGLDLGDSLRCYAREARHAVGTRPALERVECRQFIRRASNDELAASARTYAVPVAVVVERISAAAAKDGLGRTGTVIKAGMDHATVVASLVHGDQMLPFQDHDARGRAP